MGCYYVVCFRGGFVVGSGDVCCDVIVVVLFFLG